MSFECLLQDNYAVITITADKLDVSNSSDVKNELVNLNNKGYKNLLMDLSRVKYCDSSGLSSILVGNRLCKNSSGLFVVSGLSEMVSKLITVSQLNSILKIASNREEALNYFKN